VKKILLAALILALIAGCAPESARDACALSASTPARFSSADGDDLVVARALGPNCAQSVALFIVQDVEGEPVWTWTAPLARTFGEHFRAAPPAELKAFIDAWSVAHVARTSEAPAWTDAAFLPDGVLAAHLDQETYQDVRARDLPMLCHLTGVARQTCIFYEPVAAHAGAMFERDMAAPQAETEDNAEGEPTEGMIR
jgi:hypothetical protein